MTSSTNKNNILAVTNVIPLDALIGGTVKIGGDEYDILPIKKNDGQLYVMTDGFGKSVCIRLRRKNGQKTG